MKRGTHKPVRLQLDVHVRLPPEMYEWIGRKAGEQNISMSEFIRGVLKYWKNEYEKSRGVVEDWEEAYKRWGRS